MSKEVLLAFVCGLISEADVSFLGKHKALMLRLAKECGMDGTQMAKWLFTLSTEIAKQPEFGLSDKDIKQM